MSSSRPEVRDSGSKRQREPSPNKSRRDEKTDRKREGVKSEGDVRHRRDYDSKRRRRDEDEAPSGKEKDERLAGRKGSEKKKDDDRSKESDRKVEKEKEVEKKGNGSVDGKKQSSDPKELFRSRSHIQHDDRGSFRQSHRSFNQRETLDRGSRKDSRDRRGDREVNRSRTHGIHSRDYQDKSRDNGDRVWRHDGYFELESNPQLQPSRKRPAFSEKKLTANDDENGSEQPSHNNRPVLSDRDERGGRNPRYMDSDRALQRSFTGDRGNRREAQGFGQSRDRFGGPVGNDRPRDRNISGQGPRPTSFSDKWSHDLFKEANRSPTPKNEEDQIAKVEALLAS